jgi:hypothetical protein
VQLPRGKAPDNKPWPSSAFSTHSPAYTALINEVLPALGGMINEFTIFDNEGGCDAAMAAKLMQTGCTVSQLCKEISNVAEQREKVSLQRYLAYMLEQRLQAEDQLPQLPSALNLSRPSSSASHQTLSGPALASQGSLATTCLPSSHGGGFVWHNSFMERFLTLRRTAAPETEDDSCTVTTAAPQDFCVSNDGLVTRTPNAEVVSEAAQRSDRAPALSISAPNPIPTPAHAPAPAASATATFNDAAPPVASINPQLEIPPWIFVHGNASAFNVSTENITTMMRLLHRKVKPFLTADLLGRHPGKLCPSPALVAPGVVPSPEFSHIPVACPLFA